MIRGLNAVLLITSAVALVGVYGLKYQVAETAGKKVAIESEIEAQTARLSVLEAEWAYLNHPAHIAPIVSRHAEALGIAPIDQKQYGAIADLPMRPKGVDSAGLEDLIESLSQGVDPAESGRAGGGQ